MAGALSRVRRWWRAVHSGPVVPFAVPCRCGRLLRGRRRRRAQVERCPACGEPVFVFPFSPYPPVRPVADGPGARPPAPPVRPPAAPTLRWGPPLFAAAVTLVLACGGFLLAWPYLKRSRPAPATAEQQPPSAARRQLEAARRALAEGKPARAVSAARSAVALREAEPASLTGEEYRRLVQVYREADLLDRLLSVPLETVAEQGRAAGFDEQWQARFAKEYRGRTVLFDDMVRRDVRGQPVLATYQVRAGGEAVRLALEDLDLWVDLSLEGGPRLLFGARLAGLATEAGGLTFHFEPASGVLLTDADALAACCADLGDEEARATLRAQADLVRAWALPQPLPRP